MTRSTVSDETLIYGAHVVYPFNFLEMMVDQWTFLLVCVGLGHRTLENQVGAKVLTRFHPVDKKWEFPSTTPEPSKVTAHVYEGGHTWKLGLTFLIASYTCIRATHAGYCGMTAHMACGMVVSCSR